jgi:hypothetical protein
MNRLKNLAGNEISLFLFRFELDATSINFVLNEGIAADMYPDVDEQMRPLIHACCETLLRYKHLSVSNTIMDGTILATGEFEVMLSRGLGKYFPEDEKQNLFQDAKHIADFLKNNLELVPSRIQVGHRSVQAYRAQRARERLEQACNEVRQAVLTLHEHGKYPSQGRVGKQLSDPNFLFLPECAATRRAIMHELGIAEAHGKNTQRCQT